jgi:uncharacterized protein (TIGR00369 family)
MTDKFTGGPASPAPARTGATGTDGRAVDTPASGTDANPFEAQLAAHGVPPDMRARFAAHGVGTLVEKLGIVFTEMGAQRVVATMPVEGNQQVAGILHGGASVALAETLGSFAAALHGGDARMPVGVDISATHHRPGISGLVTGVCTPLHLGRTITTHEIVVTNAEGKRVCTSRITNMLLDKK